MLFGWFYYDWTMLIIIPGVILSMIAQIKVKSTFEKYSRKQNFSGMTGADAAEAVLHMNGIYDVRVVHISGDLNDHYSPKEKVIRLSDRVYGSSSIAAVGVAAHEAGHAVQHAKGYVPVKLRTAIVPTVNIGSWLSMPLLIIGIILAYDPLVYLGIAFFSFVVIFQLVTLPVEFNASGRAIKALSDRRILSGEELAGAKSVLTAAAMTYVAALVSSVLSLLRIILIANRRR